jgi:hypothetical protein
LCYTVDEFKAIAQAEKMETVKPDKREAQMRTALTLHFYLVDGQKCRLDGWRYRSDVEGCSLAGGKVLLLLLLLLLFLRPGA